MAVRLNSMYESSDSFRDSVELERWGVNPTFTIAAGPRTRLTLGYEHLHDWRIADRGITSYQGLPADVPISTYYGNPNDSRVRADVDLASASVEHQAGSLTLRNRTLFGGYDRGYQNYVPGAVNASQTLVTLTAYNNATRRDNLFDQADAVYSLTTGGVKHTLLAGAELGLQDTDNFRNTGYFDDAASLDPGALREPDRHDAGDVPPERDRRRQPPGHERRPRRTSRTRPGSRPRSSWSPDCASTASTSPTTTTGTATRSAAWTTCSRRARASS